MSSKSGSVTEDMRRGLIDALEDMGSPTAGRASTSSSRQAAPAPLNPGVARSSSPLITPAADDAAARASETAADTIAMSSGTSSTQALEGEEASYRRIGANLSMREQLEARAAAHKVQAAATAGAATQGAQQGRPEPLRNMSTDERLVAWEQRRLHRQAQAAAEARAREAEECTFNPEIHTLKERRFAVESSASDLPVEYRLAQKAQASAARRRRLMAEAEALTARACTFAPEIHASPIPHRTRSAPSESATGTDPYADGDSREEDYDGIHVFEYVPVETRTTQSRLHHMLGSDWHQRNDPECTFRPVISPTADVIYENVRVEESDMGVYERLYQRSIASTSARGGHTTLATTESSRARSSSPPRDDARDLPRAVEAELDDLRRRFGASSGFDLFTFYRNVLGTDDPQPLRGALDHTDVDSGESSDVEDGAADDDDPSLVRYVRFTDFIHRQNALEHRRRAAVQRVRREHDGTFHPFVCGRSSVLAAERKKRGGQPAVTARKHVPFDEPTFQPTCLNHKDKEWAKRGPADMLMDAQRAEARKQKLRDDKQQAVTKEHTFKPVVVPFKTSDKNQPVQSVLSLKQLPKYMNLVAAKQERRKQQTARAREHQEQATLAECTFKPTLNQVPAYISEMARSTQALRQALLTV
jgi:hypothetical protein